jgi:hypothetical protein
MEEDVEAAKGLQPNFLPGHWFDFERRVVSGGAGVASGGGRQKAD